MKKIGITTTVPSEVLLAAGYQPVDLNNVLINEPRPEQMVRIAEKAGFPLNCCAWIKGIYGVCRHYDIDTVVCVTSGDCSNTKILMDVLRRNGIRAISFAYPENPDETQMQAALEKLAGILGTNLDAANQARKDLFPVRQSLRKLDELTWKEGIISGFENHVWLVSSSDFNQDMKQYYRQLKALLPEFQQRQPYPSDYLRLAYIGVPPVYARELYPYLEKNRSRVVFNEIQRQFSMPEPGNTLAEQYMNYTYPYSIEERLRDISREIERRQIDGVIHYVQAFCHRGIADIIFREVIKLPILTIEGNADFFLNHHLKTRLEAFLDMLRQHKRASRKLFAGSDTKR
ncbi:2-hydroxyacyl-CoA dehydratase family protein [Chloroflexota bacterium]